MGRALFSGMVGCFGSRMGPASWSAASVSASWAVGARRALLVEGVWAHHMVLVGLVWLLGLMVSASAGWADSPAMWWQGLDDILGWDACIWGGVASRHVVWVGAVDVSLRISRSCRAGRPRRVRCESGAWLWGWVGRGRGLWGVGNGGARLGIVDIGSTNQAQGSRCWGWAASVGWGARAGVGRVGDGGVDGQRRGGDRRRAHGARRHLGPASRHGGCRRDGSRGTTRLAMGGDVAHAGRWDGARASAARW